MWRRFAYSRQIGKLQVCKNGAKQEQQDYSTLIENWQPYVLHSDTRSTPSVMIEQQWKNLEGSGSWSLFSNFRNNSILRAWHRISSTWSRTLTSWLGLLLLDAATHILIFCLRQIYLAAPTLWSKLLPRRGSKNLVAEPHKHIPLDVRGSMPFGKSIPDH